MDCSLPDSSVHGMSQVRILGWVAISSCRESLNVHGFLSFRKLLLFKEMAGIEGTQWFMFSLLVQKFGSKNSDKPQSVPNISQEGYVVIVFWPTRRNLSQIEKIVWGRTGSSRWSQVSKLQISDFLMPCECLMSCECLLRLGLTSCDRNLNSDLNNRPSLSHEGNWKGWYSSPRTTFHGLQKVVLIIADILETLLTLSKVPRFV